MSETDNGVIATLKAIYYKLRPSTSAVQIGSDGEIRNSPSALEEGKGINQRPNLTSGQSGGTTNPFNNDRDSSGTV